ncbi:similar to Saccharomyces cerevisiae YNL132W KRE33 Essential protein, required for biogenesis of the small ribosomal subunit [Maudiozyma barnettii]|uniref:RNA cytidine acetyltransferase n=1 Tax=Maudiozyma barnettii TaxID=61262 RepID=A0A8H2VBN7_9SACH|nr:ribosome biosynthesis protein KRE33 [Kazachstania barnettii]CAB4252306.1 similar to Saccharomyces cerevisiae YNL132W KRE33 Essential protein, required for biogenesis of the small ribosomal subunit [Kazachstania barnettii]CAD1779031.1 similar to Saccharomyces cerevisiae YNL132W KRE33 Essential protein, required for biogenesis of the small ribosomal subunit [Kazachstania barnettii]
MAKKAIDSRIPSLIRNGAQTKQRSFFVIVGDRARNQLPNLHYLMMSADLKMNKSVLWAYKKKLLGFTSHRKKREAKIKKEIKRGTREANTQDPFESFISNQDIRYVYYRETEKILGNTYGMCVLQDFEALTPNLLARTVETVEGGGIVVILLKSMASLKQLYTMTMDIHSRYRTEAHDDVVARFNERFILSLGGNENCLVVDDELNVLPISGAKNVKPLPPKDDDELSPKQIELKDLKESLEDVQPAGSLVGLSRTVNQAHAILTFIDSISEKTLNSTVALTAGRGRGKSAALGISIAAAISHGYSNIFVTSPSPENLKTLFAFIFKGFDALDYQEHIDYDIIQSTNPEFNNAIVRVDIKRGHRQTIQYIVPQDAHVLGQAELLVIDEAAAIPLPIVKNLLGPYLVFMASTINGYEGTGRSLSLKLIQQLRTQANTGGRNINQTAIVSRDNKKDFTSSVGTRTLKEIVLDEPIRYADGDAVEKWLNKLLCLDVTLIKNPRFAANGTPHPSECNLFIVNRDTLFSYHPVSENFLEKMMALYVSSHYKNSPNDLQLMSDAPAHQLFVLLPPINPKDGGRIPDPLCVIQIALEGEISKQSVRNSLSRGQRAGGDLIPWLISQQFQDEEFAGLSGARVVRIATNPEYSSMGYGSRALELLGDYFEGKFTDMSEDTKPRDFSISRVNDSDLRKSNLLKDDVKLRDAKTLPPLLLKLSEQPPHYLHYLGVSYGLTPSLHKFWKNCKYVPVYLRQTANDLTGEHTCVMLKVLDGREPNWLVSFATDFHKRFLSLLSYQFSKFTSVQSLSVLESADKAESLYSRAENSRKVSLLDKSQLDDIFSPFDLKRLDSYSNNLLDYHVIVDLLPMLSILYFSGKMGDGVSLSSVQCAILLAIGLQHKSIDDITKELNLPSNQTIAMFSKIMRKFSIYFRSILNESFEKALPALNDEQVAEMNGEEIKRLNAAETFDQMEEDLEEAGDVAVRAMREKQKELIDSLNLDKYAINDNGGDWDESNKGLEKAAKSKGVVSVKTGHKRTTEKSEDIYNNEIKALHKSKKSKKSSK